MCKYDIAEIGEQLELLSGQCGVSAVELIYKLETLLEQFPFDMGAEAPCVITDAEACAYAP